MLEQLELPDLPGGEHVDARELVIDFGLGERGGGHGDDDDRQTSQPFPVQ